MQQENCYDSVRFFNSSKSGRDKYKPHFCSKEFYLHHQNEFQTIARFTEDIPTHFRVIVWTIALACLRRKHDWYGGQTPCENSELAYPIKNFIFLYDLFCKLQIYWPEKIDPAISLVDFLYLVRIKPLPKAALSGMYRFLTGQYPLVILDYEPNSYEVLHFQTQNQWILTFDSDFKRWPDLMYGNRDPLSFWLHDFIHAEHFFSDPNKRQAQVGFYRFTQDIISSKILDQFLLNYDFYSNFSYLISDMNSHPVHLLQTLRAHVEQQNLENAIWSKIAALAAKQVERQICRSTTQNPSASYNNMQIYEALSKVNTPLFSVIDAEILTDFFIHF